MSYLIKVDGKQKESLTYILNGESFGDRRLRQLFCTGDI